MRVCACVYVGVGVWVGVWVCGCVGGCVGVGGWVVGYVYLGVCGGECVCVFPAPLPFLSDTWSSRWVENAANQLDAVLFKPKTLTPKPKRVDTKR